MPGVEVESLIMNVVSGYTPQIGCDVEEKYQLWQDMDEVVESIP